MTTEGEAEEMIALMEEMNRQGETSTAWAKLKAKLQHLLTIPERAAINMIAEYEADQLRTRTAREQSQSQDNQQQCPEHP